MAIFNLFKKKTETLQEYSDYDIVAPVNGKMIPANEISDPVFAEEVMGQTIGFIPSDGKVVCPVNGVVSVVLPTEHAFGITGNDGNEYLVHIGIDTVALDGKGFKAVIKNGESVKAGQLAVEVNLDVVKKANYEATTMLIVTEKKEESYLVKYIDFGEVLKGQKINSR